MPRFPNDPEWQEKTACWDSFSLDGETHKLSSELFLCGTLRGERALSLIRAALRFAFDAGRHAGSLNPYC